MIATLAFEASPGHVRRARFVPRAGLSIDAACDLASGVRAALQGVLGDACAAGVGEPVALDAAAWESLAHGTLAFVQPGSRTDLVFVVAQRDARALIAAAFGEEPAPHDASWSPLEAGAVERIVARCAASCDAIGGARRGPLRAIDARSIAPPAGLCDVRVAAPVPLTIAVGIDRLPVEPAPQTTLSLAALGGVTVEARAVLGSATIVAGDVLRLRVGDVVRLSTQVAGDGELKLMGQRIARGTCGVVHGRAAFDVRSLSLRGDAP